MASLWFPFGWDHGIMANVGDVILAGGMPYRDSWDIKGPLAHLWFAAAQLLFGRGQFGIRVLDLALLIWAAVVLGRAGARLLNRSSAAPWIAMGLVLCHASLTYFYTAQPDGAASLLLTLVLSPLLISSRPRQIVIAGLVIGICALVKPFYLIFLALPLLVVFRLSGSTPTQRRRLVLMIGAAAAAPIVAALVWIIWRGAFDAMVEVLFRYNAFEYSGANQLAVRTRLAGYARYLWSGPAAPALAFIVFGSVVAYRSRSVGERLVAWLLLALALVGLQGKFYPYHWIVIFPPAVLLVAMAFDALVAAPATPGRSQNGLSVLGYAGVVTIAGSLAVQPAIDIGNWVRLMAGVYTPAQYQARFRLGQYSAADQIAAAEYIRAHTDATDRIAIFGYEAPIVFLSGRTNATRFGYALPLVGWQSSQAARDRYRREFLAALDDRPEYIIVGILLLGGTESIEVFPEFEAFLKRGYRLDRSFGAVDLYRRIP